MSAEPPIVELTPAPEIYVDGYQSNMLVGGVAKLTFWTIAHDITGEGAQRRVVLRLSAALPALAGIHEAIGRFLAEAQREAIAARATAEYARRNEETSIAH